MAAPDLRDNAAQLSHQRLVSTPAAIERHVAYCKVCKLPAEVRSTVNMMIAEGETNGTICKALDSMGYPGFSNDNIIGHRSMFKYVADEDAITQIVAKVGADEHLKQQYLTEYEEEVVKLYAEVQKYKTKELVELWGSVIPAVREKVLDLEKQSMLPIDSDVEQ